MLANVCVAPEAPPLESCVNAIKDPTHVLPLFLWQEDENIQKNINSKNLLFILQHLVVRVKILCQKYR